MSYVPADDAGLDLVPELIALTDAVVADLDLVSVELLESAGPLGGPE